MGILVAMEISSTPRGIILKQSQVVDGLGEGHSNYLLVFIMHET